MNRTSFLFLALLIGSCIVTVNSRHQARSLISEKAVLREKVTSLNETIRRLEMDKSRLAAKLIEPAKIAEPTKAGAAPAAPARDKRSEPSSMSKEAQPKEAPSKEAHVKPAAAKAARANPVKPEAHRAA